MTERVRTGKKRTVVIVADVRHGGMQSVGSGMECKDANMQEDVYCSTRVRDDTLYFEPLIGGDRPHGTSLRAAARITQQEFGMKVLTGKFRSLWYKIVTSQSFIP